MTKGRPTAAASDRPPVVGPRLLPSSSVPEDHTPQRSTELLPHGLLLLDAPLEGEEGRRAFAIRERAAGVPELQGTRYPTMGHVTP